MRLSPALGPGYEMRKTPREFAGRGVDSTPLIDQLCVTEQECVTRNFTCCGDGLKEQEYGLATLNGNLELCKALSKGWRTRLNVYTLTDQWQPRLNLISNVVFRLDGRSYSKTASQEYLFDLNADVSSLSTQHFAALSSSFKKFCDRSSENCRGDRVPSIEETSGLLACYTPPSTGDETYREWLEASFPLIQVDVGSPKNSFCVSPWSYFVPLPGSIFCVGIYTGSGTILGGNLLEGHSITFQGNGQVQVGAAKSRGCFLSRLCDTALPENTTAETEISQNMDSYDVVPPGQSHPLMGNSGNSNSPSLSPTQEINGPATEPSRGTSTRSPSSRFNDYDDSPSEKQSPPTNRPFGSIHGSAEATDEVPTSSSDQQDDTDVAPLIWFGVGSGITFLFNCALFLYCRCCRTRASQHKFSRLPADVEMTAQPPPVIQVTTQHTGPEPMKTSLASAITGAAAPFEQNPVLTGGASAFERAWNQGLIVDVWGITLNSWQPSVVVDLLTRLRLLRVASGTVSGVEKMYWIAKQRPLSLSSPEVLGMIEISVDLTTKRLSAVFKMSRSAPSTSREAQPLHDLFEAFKRVIEEVLC